MMLLTVHVNATLSNFCNVWLHLLPLCVCMFTFYVHVDFAPNIHFDGLQRL